MDAEAVASPGWSLVTPELIASLRAESEVDVRRMLEHPALELNRASQAAVLRKAMRLWDEHTAGELARAVVDLASQVRP